MGGVLNKRKELLLRLTLVAGSLLFTFALGEIVCRIFFPDRQLRYTNDPEALWYFSPRQTGTTALANGDQAPPASINELGFRGKPLGESGGRRILLLGDSFTFGSGVRDDETFAWLLDEALGEEVSVVNGGQLGYGVFQMAAALNRVIETVKPEVVAVVLWQGDFLRQAPTEAERAEYFKRKRLLAFFKSSLLVTHVYRQLEPALLRLGGGGVVIQVGDRGVDAGSDSAAVINQHVRGLKADLPRLVAMHEQAKRYGRGLVLVLWPKEGFAPLPASERGLAAQLTERLAAFASANGIPFISAQSALDTIPSASLLVPFDGHPSALAHCRVAGHIARGLDSLGYGPVNSRDCRSTPG